MSQQVNQVKSGARFIADTAHRESNDRCLWAARMRRDAAAASLPEWEEMRQLASDTKVHILANLDKYLQQFEENAVKAGVHIHHAADAEEHNAIIRQIFEKHGVKTVTKGKSMTMDECDTRKYLEKYGFEIFEGDLGERIQQLDDQRDSHIVMPAIHKLRSDVARLFADKLGSNPDDSSPEYLNSVMRANMRPKYVAADAGMSGVNFAVADSGTIAVASNEGDVDICMEVPPVYVASMGIEKVVPGNKELALFMRLLSRSALGYAITQYTTHIHGPRPGQEMHIVILDNGRSKRLKELYWPVMKCIRCGACMNTCPVFRRTSGISYDATYMGPLGLALQPSYDLRRYARLPYSCTHCGSCGDVCPVKVPLPELIFYWREVIVANRESLFLHDAEMEAATMVLKSAANLQMAEKLGLFFLRHTPEAIAQSAINPWAKWHDNPEAPKQTFRQWYKENVGELPNEKRIAEGQQSSMKNCTKVVNEIHPQPNPYNIAKGLNHTTGDKPVSLGKPEIPRFDVAGDPLQNFIDRLEGFDGKYHLISDRKEALEWLACNVINSEKRVCSVLPDLEGNFSISKSDLPADMHLVDICIAEAELAVGETGSLLVSTSSLQSPAAALFSTDLYLLIDRKKLVAGLQEAYDIINLADNRYTAFFSGPSATADIEAVHITGAQGEISLTALIYD